MYAVYLKIRLSILFFDLSLSCCFISSGFDQEIIHDTHFCRIRKISRD